MGNLIEGLMDEMNRNRELIKVYESLDGGVGAFGAAMMKQDVAEAERAISTGDIIAELQVYEKLKSNE